MTNLTIPKKRKMNNYIFFPLKKGAGGFFNLFAKTLDFANISNQYIIYKMYL
jgi:hypothetical protein